MVRRVKAGFEGASVSARLKALLAITGKVQRAGKVVTTEDVERARREGASEWKFTVPCSSPRPSVCTTAMWTVLIHGSRRMPACMPKRVSTSLSRAI